MVSLIPNPMPTATIIIRTTPDVPEDIEDANLLDWLISEKPELAIIKATIQKVN